jgi:hypothetical protein
MVARLKDPVLRERIKKEMGKPSVTWEDVWHGTGGGSGIMLIGIRTPELTKYEGMTLEEIGRQMNKDPKDAAMDMRSLIVVRRARLFQLWMKRTPRRRTRVRFPLGCSTRRDIRMRRTIPIAFVLLLALMDIWLLERVLAVTRCAEST